MLRFIVTVELSKRDSKRKTGEYLSLAEACKIIGISPRKRLSLLYIPTENQCDKIVIEGIRKGWIGLDQNGKHLR